jgi:transposase-like protein
MTAGHRMQVDHSSISNWVVEFAPKLGAGSRQSDSKCPVAKSWQIDEPVIKIDVLPTHL